MSTLQHSVSLCCSVLQRTAYSTETCPQSAGAGAKAPSSAEFRKIGGSIRVAHARIFGAVSPVAPGLGWY